LSYQVLSRKWRPQFFREVVGQEHVILTLQNAIKRGRVGHAYLFSGPRGVGKTTTARILAKALNCEKGPAPEPCNECSNCKSITEGRSMDVLEIDGASHRGVEEVRALRENVKFSPTSSLYKVYIIDEVHMLTNEAFNALLKTLEEPPEHVRFIFATTSPHKVPLTILSRCQRFDFHKIPLKVLVEKLKEVSHKENIEIAEGAFLRIARISDGSLRDAESILDQLVSYVEGEIKEKDVDYLMGKVGREHLSEFILSLEKGEIGKCWGKVEELSQEGKPLEGFLDDCGEFLKDVLFLKIGIGDSEIRQGELCQEIRNIQEERLIELMENLVELRERVRRSDTPLLTLEAGLVKFSRKEAGRGRVEPGESKSTVPLSTPQGTVKGAKVKTEKAEERAPQAESSSPGKDSWEQVVKEVKKLGNLLYAILKGSKVKEMKEDKIVIALPCNAAYFNTIPQKDKLSDWIKSKLGKEPEFIFREEKPKKEKKEKYDKIVEKAMGLFNAKVVRKENNG